MCFSDSDFFMISPFMFAVEDVEALDFFHYLLSLNYFQTI